LAERAPGKVISFGTDPRADVIGTDVQCSVQGTRFVVDGQVTVNLHLLGRHAVSNALAALACARAAGLDLEPAAEGVGRVLSAPGRLQIRPLGDLTVIDDTYNANPGSLRAAMRTLSELRWPGRMVVVLGDMLELGDEAQALHHQAGVDVAEAAPLMLVGVGRHAGDVVAGARSGGLPASVCHACEGWEDAVSLLGDELRRNDTVLVKGSRGVVLDKLVGQLVDLAPQVA
jgi:UDP-N-acetylmuramoyl-tripeptide--D-alanyl-D-alanine ligase